MPFGILFHALMPKNPLARDVWHQLTTGMSITCLARDMRNIIFTLSSEGCGSIGCFIIHKRPALSFP